MHQQEPPAEASTRSRLPLLHSVRARRLVTPEDPVEHGRRLVERAHASWIEAYGASSVEIAIGTAATLMLLPRLDEHAPHLCGLVAELGPADLMTVFRRTWGRLWLEHPHLAERAGPLHGWLDHPTEAQALSAAELSKVLIATGVVDYSADSSRCLSYDVLGQLLQRMRGHKDKQQRGAFHSPQPVTDFMVDVLAAGAPAGSWGEIAAGTGAMWRSVAQRRRAEGRSTADDTWVGIEIDGLSAAVLAANAMIWDLGPHVLVVHGDALAQRDLSGPERERTAALEHRDAVLAEWKVHTAETFIARVAALLDTPVPPRPGTATSPAPTTSQE